MPGRTVARQGRISARHVRGFGAALIAVAALVTAANAGPARAAAPAPAQQVAVQNR
ncbi:hypothetical protein [Streptomyces carpinensis]|uniref:hypothetical protein n=1 Tax=Streptomyces carpinensis TaxID=66369 RepID=UPI00130290DB|nr:hypothetical protein [Streptomyces carpinensis]